MTMINKTLIAALSFLFFMALSPVSNAAENPFGMTDNAAEQMQVADSHGKCGQGKSSDEEKKSDDASKSASNDGKCAEGKCGEGKCGDSMRKAAKSSKCGTGKCGGN